MYNTSAIRVLEKSSSFTDLVIGVLGTPVWSNLSFAWPNSEVSDGGVVLGFRLAAEEEVDSYPKATRISNWSRILMRG